MSQGSLNMIAGLNPNACVSALNALLSAIRGLADQGVVAGNALQIRQQLRAWCAGGRRRDHRRIDHRAGCATGLVAAGPVHMPLVHEYQRRLVASWAHTVCVAAT